MQKGTMRARGGKQNAGTQKTKSVLLFLLLRNLPLDIPGLVSKFIPINFSREEIFWGDYFTFAVELNT